MKDPPGTKIPGARLVRDYCRTCGQPIRVLPGKTYGHEECEECNYHPPPGMHANITPRQKSGLRHTS